MVGTVKSLRRTKTSAGSFHGEGLGYAARRSADTVVDEEGARCTWFGWQMGTPWGENRIRRSTRTDNCSRDKRRTGNDGQAHTVAAVFAYKLMGVRARSSTCRTCMLRVRAKRGEHASERQTTPSGSMSTRLNLGPLCPARR